MTVVVHVKKIWKGMVSVRDYIVRSTMESGRDLVIFHKGKRMVVPNENLAGAMQKDFFDHKSKFNKETYRLINFVWKPEGETNGQGTLGLN